MEVELQVPNSYDNTRIKEFKFRYEWTISNFNLIATNFDNGDLICSPSFFTKTNFGEKLQWCLKLYPKGEVEARNEVRNSPRCHNCHLCFAVANVNEPGYVLQPIDSEREKSMSLMLCLLNGKYEYPITYKLSLLNSEPSKQKSMKFTNQFIPGVEFGSNSFIPPSLLCGGFTPDNKLTILCEGSGTTVANTARSYNFAADQNLFSFFKNQEFCDFTFSFSEKEIKVHKVILAARSPIFKSMFTHDTDDTRKNHTVIKDIDYETFLEMMHYIYTEEVLNLEKFAYELFSAADKYALIELKSMCEKALCCNLAVENALDIFKLADLHSSYLIKSAAMKFIKNHFNPVLFSDAWDLLAQEGSHILTEILDCMAVKLDLTM